MPPVYFHTVQSYNSSRISSHLFERVLHLNDKEVRTLLHCSGVLSGVSLVFCVSREHEVRLGVLRRGQTVEMLSDSFWPHCSSTLDYLTPSLKAETHCLWLRLFIASLEWRSYAQNKGLCLLAQGVSPQSPSQWMPSVYTPMTWGLPKLPQIGLFRRGNGKHYILSQ